MGNRSALYIQAIIGNLLGDVRDLRSMNLSLTANQMGGTTELPHRQIQIREGDPVKFMTRVMDANNEPILQANLSGGSIRWELFDLNSATPRTSVVSGTLEIADVIFTSLQTPDDDAAWSEDQVGYNFMYLAPASLFKMAGTRGGKYLFQVRGIPSSGEPFWIGAWKVEVFDMVTSFAGEED